MGPKRTKNQQMLLPHLKLFYFNPLNLEQPTAKFKSLAKYPRISVSLKWYKDQLPATVCDDTRGYLNTHPIVTKAALGKHCKMHVS
jgi:hypothetical protein